ncbi:ORF314 [White spot syndrome virus]|uniref:Wsv273 n=3 Tax=White spot syndrome virus TaxID=342409 RepID=Q8VAV5_WSSVS|nr:wsv273 [Shrimp white spot syndrome virus]AFX59647.1 wsv273 [White spot syndrome virus]AAL33276.1 wsv273 [Shrimp white spot syndrome virus]AAL89196.1 WSSV328 [Shrimp white spot syndrome virus]ATU83730.1 ORF314 [White spot syndrome virus]AWQ60850.1 wsv273 [Shrimp white spot syndrome virus]
MLLLLTNTSLIPGTLFRLYKKYVKLNLFQRIIRSEWIRPEILYYFQRRVAFLISLSSPLHYCSWCPTSTLSFPSSAEMFSPTAFLMQRAS